MQYSNTKRKSRNAEKEDIELGAESIKDNRLKLMRLI